MSKSYTLVSKTADDYTPTTVIRVQSVNALDTGDSAVLRLTGVDIKTSKSISHIELSTRLRKSSQTARRELTDFVLSAAGDFLGRSDGEASLPNLAAVKSAGCFEVKTSFLQKVAANGNKLPAGFKLIPSVVIKTGVNRFDARVFVRVGGFDLPIGSYGKHRAYTTVRAGHLFVTRYPEDLCPDKAKAKHVAEFVAAEDKLRAKLPALIVKLLETRIKAEIAAKAAEQRDYAKKIAACKLSLEKLVDASAYAADKMDRNIDRLSQLLAEHNGTAPTPT